MTGAEMIAAERQRQIEVEGYTEDEDDAQNEFGELAHAACVYLGAAISGDAEKAPPTGWPWDAKFWKPASPIRMLVKAGALIAAEIDRRLRAGEQT